MSSALSVFFKMAPAAPGPLARRVTPVRFKPGKTPAVAPRRPAAIAIRALSKTYASGLPALRNINLDIRRGEIFALLGANGAGKTTLINIICGIVSPGEGEVCVDGHDIVADFRHARALIGLVPQELTTDSFETVWATVSFSRGLFGKRPDPAWLEKTLRDLSLWDKRNEPIRSLSGGMKRRLLIAKALSHQPAILFLDEPTAGVDVMLRREMWQLVRQLRADGVTVVLTTHYIEEAQDMADRIGIIDKGELIVVEEKAELLRKFGNKRMTLSLSAPLHRLPAELAAYDLRLGDDGHELVYSYGAQGEMARSAALLDDLGKLGILFRDLHTAQRSLEDIVVSLHQSAGAR